MGMFFPLAGRLHAGGERMSRGFEPPTRQERNKYRAAEAAGLLERVLEVGWAGLSAKESGKIGGLAARMNREKD